MSLLQQAIQLLSETPGNVVYHLITLFALQVVFAIAYSQWRRDSADALSLRMAWAASAIFLSRIAFLLAGMVLQNDPFTAVTALAPLEQAVHTITIICITWAFVPHSTRYPRLAHVLLVLSLAGTAVMTLSFVQTWQGEAAVGEAYNGSGQATVWGIIQLALLGWGLVYLLSRSRLRFSLRAIILGLLLLAHVAHFGDYPEIIPTNTNIAYWIRLGHLVVFPLWAAMAYRHTVGALLLTRQRQPPARAQVSQSLELATGAISSLEPETAVASAITMAARMTQAPFVGLALFNELEDQQLVLTSNQPQAVQPTGENKPANWYLNLVDWPAFRQALDQKQPVTLLPEGVGARQLSDWYREIGIPPLGALLVQPLLVGNEAIGLLLLAGLSEQHDWDELNKLLIKPLAAYLARVIDNGRYLARAAQQTTTMLPERDTAVSGRILTLEEERNQLQAELNTITGRLQQAEARAITANKQARDLAATLNEIEQVGRDEQITALEAEIEALRESLIEAEEAMALAAASEGELSTEWVMHTITRYSGQLEEAQERIQALESELIQLEKGPMNEIIASLVQELRTPMTSIAGYTDILLAERVGILGIRQRDFVQRVQANTARMGSLLDQLLQLTTQSEISSSRPGETAADVEAAIETAVSAVLTQAREKNLQLEMNIAPDLPPLAINQNALHQIMISLLDNACRSSANDGRVKVTARAHALQNKRQHDNENKNDPIQFLHLAVTDSGGGIRVEDRSRVFEPQHSADSPLIAGLGDTGAALSVARALAEANGGRIWVDSLMGFGSTFSALFTLSESESAANGDTGATTDTLSNKGSR